MRRLLATALALAALAACKVDVEGAPCATPGATADCPSGQACGVDAKCSTRATQCLDASQRCVPETRRCSPQGERIETCTASDPCGAWEFPPGSQDCDASGLECATGPTPFCQCLAFEGPEFAADPVEGSASSLAPFPTGAASPPECRFRSLADAVSRAGQVAGPAVVRAQGASGARVVFDATSGDGPITIPSNVTVTGAAGAAATVLSAPAQAGTPLVTVQGVLQGFEIDGGAAGTAVATSCGTGMPALIDVVVDGGAVAAVGVDVSGTCGAVLTRVHVSNVAGPALSVHADPSAPVSVYGGALRSSGVGARVTGGNVTFGADGDPQGSVEVSGHTNEGVVLTTGAAVTAALYGAAVHGNGGTGIAVDRVSLGSALTLSGCDVLSNGTGAPRSYGPSGSQRLAGGVLVAQGSLPSFTFVANRLYANMGDQLAFESSGSWVLGPTTCGAASNLFTCVTAGAYAVGIAAGGSVNARSTVWPEVPFSPWVSANVTGSYCNGQAGVPPTPVCTAP